MKADVKARIELTEKEWEVISDFLLCCFFNYDGVINLTSAEIGTIMRWLEYANKKS